MTGEISHKQEPCAILQLFLVPRSAISSKTEISVPKRKLLPTPTRDAISIQQCLVVLFVCFFPHLFFLFPPILTYQRTGLSELVHFCIFTEVWQHSQVQSLNLNTAMSLCEKTIRSKQTEEIIIYLCFPRKLRNNAISLELIYTANIVYILSYACISIYL